jgi:citrate/tricarballylate utilization protein
MFAGELPASSAHASEAHASEALLEADRLMTVCNSCRYCEGLCAVFPAMEMRRVFADGDLRYLANLCHGCGACFIDCQFSPPHAFDVNVPKVLEEVRAESYSAFAWPASGAALFARNGLATGLIAAASVALFLLGFAALGDPKALLSSHAGDFYALMPHNAMAGLFGAVFVFALAAIGIGVSRFWKAAGALPPSKGGRAFWQAANDAGRLRYLDGGGDGCFTGERRTDRRRLYHHLTFYGFLACFAATSVATVYHFALGREAPYPWYDLPVLLGTAGGIGLVIGPVGLLASRRGRDPALGGGLAGSGLAGEDAFTAMLVLTSLTGLALLVLRDTPAMAIILAVHLGFVFAFFLTMPYGKFVHGIFRFAALMRYARERQAGG